MVVSLANRKAEQVILEPSTLVEDYFFPGLQGDPPKQEEDISWEPVDDFSMVIKYKETTSWFSPYRKGHGSVFEISHGDVDNHDLKK